MKLIIEIDLKGEAFDTAECESAAGEEIQRILNHARINGYLDYLQLGDTWPLRDINGNPCGSVRVTE